ncbi:hypothetical protein MLD38_028240 [Melastoma candidum]|uniref:Uncharacterized protein n=1 Tax=Melastoma candidum TaxID=119954 RepID=A0ACB9N062_9MYRT|nr:hypothetical protein MLD38_028240 [Melastoma candidum]
MQEDDYDGYPRRRYPQQVPAFGSWDCFQDVDDLSRCFEAARQAGYICYAAAADRGDLYQDHVVVSPPTMIVVPRPVAKAGGEKSWVSSGHDDDDDDGVVVDMDMDRRRWRNPKPVDEDLYKISPQLHHSIIETDHHRRTWTRTRKKKKKKGLWRVFTSCLVPCASS